MGLVLVRVSRGTGVSSEEVLQFERKLREAQREVENLTEDRDIFVVTDLNVHVDRSSFSSRSGYNSSSSSESIPYHNESQADHTLNESIQDSSTSSSDEVEEYDIIEVRDI